VFEDNVLVLKEKGVKKMSPFTVPYMLANMSGAILGMQAELGFRGPNYAVLNTKPIHLNNPSRLSGPSIPST